MASETWECRYFLRALPYGLTREGMAERFRAIDAPLVERDTYVLGADEGLNLKVRARTASVKVRELVERADDGFELWRTPINAALPAPAAIWTDVASRLSVERDASRLAALSDPHAVAAALCEAGDVRCLEVGKERVFFRRQEGHVELAEVTVPEGVFRSVAFESPHLAFARSLRAELEGAELGRPENYVRFCLRMAGRAKNL
jgi:hypothetical protein